jgi:hypothetical protein
MRLGGAGDAVGRAAGAGRGDGVCAGAGHACLDGATVSRCMLARMRASVVALLRCSLGAARAHATGGGRGKREPAMARTMLAQPLQEAGDDHEGRGSRTWSWRGQACRPLQGASGRCRCSRPPDEEGLLLTRACDARRGHGSGP